LMQIDRSLQATEKIYKRGFAQRHHEQALRGVEREAFH